jgi:hypothetical protein
MHNRRSLAAGIYDEVPELWNRQDRLEINGAIREAIELTRGEAMKNDVSVQTELADGLPLIQGDRVQLQQVDPQLDYQCYRGHERRQPGAARIADQLRESRVKRRARRGAGFGSGAGSR